MVEEGNGDITNSSENVLHEEFIFKDEWNLKLQEEKNKCIRSILWTAEVVLRKADGTDYKKLRKAVLDAVNDFSRKCSLIVEKMV